MAKRSKPNLVKTIKKMSREAQLAREKMVGKARSKTFDTCPSKKAEKQKIKNNLRDFDKEI